MATITFAIGADCPTPCRRLPAEVAERFLPSCFEEPVDPGPEPQPNRPLTSNDITAMTAIPLPIRSILPVVGPGFETCPKLAL